MAIAIFGPSVEARTLEEQAYLGIFRPLEENLQEQLSKGNKFAPQYGDINLKFGTTANYLRSENGEIVLSQVNYKIKPDCYLSLKQFGQQHQTATSRFFEVSIGGEPLETLLLMHPEEKQKVINALKETSNSVKQYIDEHGLITPPHGPNK